MTVPGHREGPARPAEIELEDFIGRERDDAAAARAGAGGELSAVGGDEEKREPGSESGVRNVVERVVRRVTEHPVVAAISSVLDIAERAGGGLLVAGLAFHALFAILPALLLLAGVSGFLFDDPERRAALIRDLVQRFPPIADVVRDHVQAIVREKSTLSAVALVGLLWGSSNFYGSLDEAMLRIFSRGAARSLIERRIRGMLGVLILLAAAVASVIAGSVWQVIEGTVRIGEDPTLVRLASPLLTMAVMSLAVLLVYRIVPTAPPSWRASWLPALVTGIAIASLTLLFSAISRVLVAGLQAFGALTTLFAALIWLNYVFQALILGAAWARRRKDRELEARGQALDGQRAERE